MLIAPNSLDPVVSERISASA